MIFPLQALLDGWRSLRDRPVVRLALLDVDGCVTGGEASPLDFEALARLQQLNRRAAEDPTVPGLALCTGRQEPYVELLTQAIGGYLPSIWENGAGLYLPSEYRFLLHPLIDAERLAAFDEARRLVAETLIRPGLARPQPGKEVSVTLYATERSTLDQLYELASRALEALRGLYWVRCSLTTVEVLPYGIDKGAGVRWLLDELGLGPGRALGVGDSPADVEIFRAAGLGAAPANAAPELQDAADYVAALPASRGTVEILEWCIARNRAALAG